MIPRLQARGKSFKESCRYVLHDKQAETRDRVAWTLTRNIAGSAPDAWFEMYETWRNQARLKENAGLSARGRKNTAPVLHYTLSWHEDDRPDRQEMIRAAMQSLKAMGLTEHEALIAAHDDTKHPHLHVIVNTVHPYTGRTAELKYSKERLSEWAQGYEQARGQIRCEERVANNDKRAALRKARAEAREQGTASQAPYTPVKHAAVSRDKWFERQEIVDRMKALRRQMDAGHAVQRHETAKRHEAERDALDADTRAALDHSAAQVKARYRPRWREAYRRQKSEERLVGRGLTHPLERAVFVYRNRERLGDGRRLGVRAMVGMILVPGRLEKALGQAHIRERRAIAREEKTEAKFYRERIWASHRERFHTLRERQAVERRAERAHQHIETRTITLARAKDDLMREAGVAPPAPVRAFAPVRIPASFTESFNHAAWAPTPLGEAELYSRAERIRRDMEVWRRTNPDRDFGREL